MKLPPLYALFCMLVLGGFAYGKYQGLMLFGSDNGTERSAGGGHGSGAYLGSHK